MTYDKPFKLRVMHALTDALKQITPANGYKHDLSASVFRGRKLFGEDDPIPMVSILEAELPVATSAPGRDSGLQKGSWPLLIQGFTHDDHVNPTDPAYLLMADVQQRLAGLRRPARGSAILDMQGRVTEIKIGQGIVRPPDNGESDKAYFWLTLTLDLAENLETPYE